MNGYTVQTSVGQRLKNLVEQIPQQHRANYLAAAMPADGNPHDLERYLTGIVLCKPWLTEHAQKRDAADAEIHADWLDELRTREDARY
jgi:hypothetical protein